MTNCSYISTIGSKCRDLFEKAEEIRSKSHLPIFVLGMKSYVTDPIEIDLLITRTVDVLVNNAGIVFVKEMVNMAEDEWDGRVNLV